MFGKVPNLIRAGITERQYDSFCSHIFVPQQQGWCWEWFAHRNRSGYGMCTVGSKANGTNRLVVVHRLAFMLWRDSIADGLCVCHSCDNRSCVNPEHLWLGTHSENMRDMASKGRGAKNPQFGEAHGMARLTKESIAEIRTQLSCGDSHGIIASRFGVSRSNICKIAARKSWGWLQ